MPDPTVRPFDAVVFDFSGVMVSSAFDALGRHAAGHGMTEDEFLEFLLGPYAQDSDHAWHRAERGEIGILDWATDTMARAEEAMSEIAALSVRLHATLVKSGLRR